jgi:hypothetical protein
VWSTDYVHPQCVHVAFHVPLHTDPHDGRFHSNRSGPLSLSVTEPVHSNHTTKLTSPTSRLTLNYTLVLVFRIAAFHEISPSKLPTHTHFLTVSVYQSIKAYGGEELAPHILLVDRGDRSGSHFGRFTLGERVRLVPCLCHSCAARPAHLRTGCTVATRGKAAITRSPAQRTKVGVDGASRCSGYHSFLYSGRLRFESRTESRP